MCLLLTKWAGKSASPLAVSWSVIFGTGVYSPGSCLMKYSSFSSGQALLCWSTLHALSWESHPKLPPSGRRKVKDILLAFKYYLSRGDGRNQAQLVDELDRLLWWSPPAGLFGSLRSSLSPDGLPHPLLWDETATKSHPAKYGAQQINTCHLAASESLILAQLFSKIAASKPDQSCSWPTWWHRTLSASFPQSESPENTRGVWNPCHPPAATTRSRNLYPG